MQCVAFQVTPPVAWPYLPISSIFMATIWLVFSFLINFPVAFLAVRSEFVLLSEDVTYAMIKDSRLQESAPQ